MSMAGASPRKSWLGWGGRIQVSQNHLPPNSDFSSDFAYFILDILENPKVLAKIPKIVFKKPWFQGETSPVISNRGGHVPRIPPGGAAHGATRLQAPTVEMVEAIKLVLAEPDTAH